MITQDVFTSGKSLLGAILSKMTGISKWQKDFFVQSMLLFLTINGKINFTQMERYSSSPEVRYRNMYKNEFGFAHFNSTFTTEHCSDELLIGFDPSFLSKSGKHTSNVGYFYSGVAGMVKRGIELGCLAIIDVKQNTAYHFDALQTPRVNKEDAQTMLVNHYYNIFADRIDVLK